MADPQSAKLLNLDGELPDIQLRRDSGQPGFPQ
jgi:hypothetical protein